MNAINFESLTASSLKEYLEEQSSAKLCDDTKMDELSRLVLESRNQKFKRTVQSACIGFVHDYLSSVRTDVADDFLAFIVNAKVLVDMEELCSTLCEFVTIRIDDLNRTVLDVAQVLLKSCPQAAMRHVHVFWFDDLRSQAVHEPTWENLDFLYEILDFIPSDEYSKEDFLCDLERLSDAENFESNIELRRALWSNKVEMPLMA